MWTAATIRATAREVAKASLAAKAHSRTFIATLPPTVHRRLEPDHPLPRSDRLDGGGVVRSKDIVDLEAFNPPPPKRRSQIPRKQRWQKMHNPEPQRATESGANNANSADPTSKDRASYVLEHRTRDPRVYKGSMDPRGADSREAQMLADTTSPILVLNISHVRRAATYKDETLKTLAIKKFLKRLSSSQLNQHLSEAKRTIYLGIDPTSPSLHLGHLIPIFSLITMVRNGHRGIILIGGATGTVGDPTGRHKARPRQTFEKVARNVASLKAQLDNLLASLNLYFKELQRDRKLAEADADDTDPPEYEASRQQSPSSEPSLPLDIRIIDNSILYKDMNVLTFLRDIGSHARLSQMLSRDSVQDRLPEPFGRAPSGSGMSFTELSYQLLQAYDFWRLFSDPDFACTVQIGGSDQMGNILAGVDLIRRKEAERLGKRIQYDDDDDAGVTESSSFALDDGEEAMAETGEDDPLTSLESTEGEEGNEATASDDETQFKSPASDDETQSKSPASDDATLSSSPESSIESAALGSETETKAIRPDGKVRPAKSQKTKAIRPDGKVSPAKKQTQPEVVEGQTPVAYGFTVPLLLDAKGKKMSKSTGTALSIDPSQTTDYALYQHFMRLSHDQIANLIGLCFLTTSEFEHTRIMGYRWFAEQSAERSLGREIPKEHRRLPFRLTVNNRKKLLDANRFLYQHMQMEQSLLPQEMLAYEVVYMLRGLRAADSAFQTTHLLHRTLRQAVDAYNSSNEPIYGAGAKLIALKIGAAGEKVMETLWEEGKRQKKTKDAQLHFMDYDECMGKNVLKLAVEVNLFESASAARRAFEGGGVYLNNVQVRRLNQDWQHTLDVDDVVWLNDEATKGLYILRHGKKDIKVLLIEKKLKEEAEEDTWTPFKGPTRQ